MAHDVLITERLRLRERTIADLEACVAMDLDPEVHRFIYGNRPPERRQHRAQLGARIASGWPPQGGIWVVEWRDARLLLARRRFESCRRSLAPVVEREMTPGSQPGSCGFESRRGCFIGWL